MMVDIARYQVDIVAGDANKASYTLKKKQAEPSFYDSSFNTMMRGLEKFYATQPARMAANNGLSHCLE